MSTATSTQTTSTECPSTESRTTADPVLTREEAIAILDAPDSELPELLKRAGALRRKYKGNRVSIHLLTNARSGNCSQNCAYCFTMTMSLSMITTLPATVLA